MVAKIALARAIGATYQVLFLRAYGRNVEQLIAGGGKVASGHAVMICDQCVDVQDR